MLPNQRLLSFIRESSVEEVTPEKYPQIFSPEFVTFFLNFIHSSAVELFDLRKNAKILPAKLASEVPQSSSILSDAPRHKKGRSFERASTPKHSKSASEGCVRQSNEKQRLNCKRFENVSSNNLADITTSMGNMQLRGKRNVFDKSYSGKEYPTNYKNKLKTTRMHSDAKPLAFNNNTQSFNSNCERFDISSSSDFPSLDSDAAIKPNLANNLKKKVRRIKPTLVTTTSASSEKCCLFNTTPCGDNAKETDAKQKPVLKEERDLLLRTRILSAEISPNAEIETTQQAEISLDSQLQYISPVKIDNDIIKVENEVQTVVQSKELNVLAHLYSLYIETRYVWSFVEELHLLVMLLLLDNNHLYSMTQENNDDPLKALLRTVTSAKHFAANTLVKIPSDAGLGVFNNETLTLLLSHINGITYMKELEGKVAEEIERRSGRKIGDSVTYCRPRFDAVPFKADLDDRSNFENDKAFHSFRKQRDMFYSLIREWDEKHIIAENVPRDILGKARWLIGQVKSQSTFNAFVRLFIDQLFCIGVPNDKPQMVSSTHYSLACLLKGDPEKLRLLENRVTKPSQNALTPFQGWMHQEFQFFRDFVTIVDSYMFNIRLCDALQQRILKTELQNSHIGDTDNEESNPDVEQIHQAIYQLRICGSFYGFLVFLPYQDYSSPQREISPAESAAGQFVLSGLERAIKNNHLLLTLPWIIQFLNFSTSCNHNKVFKAIFQKLCSLYRHSPKDGYNKLQVYLGVAIGSLFEQDAFDSQFFYDHMKTAEIVSIKTDDTSVDSASEKLVAHSVLYDMHWRLQAITNLLKFKSTSLTKRQLPKKIKPSTEKLPESNNSQSFDLQSSLEDNFFRNQPVSLKKTVTFVAERIHSNCIKYLCSTVLPVFCDNSDLLKRYKRDVNVENIQELQREITTKIFPSVFSHLKEEGARFNSENVKQSMDVLVSSTISREVLRVATGYAEKQSLLAVQKWLDLRLHDHLVIKVKNCLISKDNDKRKESQISISGLVHSVREKVIMCQKVKDLEKVKATVGEQLNNISDLLAEADNETFSDIAPNHVLSAISFLVCELLSFLSPSQMLPNPTDVIDVIEMDEKKFRLLKRLVHAYTT
ncbi:codanin-1-like isoform X2 [Clavelina lepadiformis]|uniref:codanin-1-like isoform X2 n=1 Tax=Clavelina lepadiformis TaxID=159417 RepID=UPI0040427AD4